jgi:hypothetical protein
MMEFQIGDKVRFRSTISPMNGMIATVVKVPDEGYEFLSPYYGLDFGIETGRTHNIQGLLPGPTGWIVNEEHASVLMELVQRREEMEFRVGDLVEVFCEDGDCNLDRVEQGMVGTVIQTDSDGTVLVSFEGFDGHTTDEMDAWWVWKRHLKPATTIEKSKKGDDGMTEIEKLSREALDEIYHVMWSRGGDEVDYIEAVEAIIARYNSDVEQIKIKEELAKRPFQVGDIITGIEGHHYLYTTEDAIMQVVEVFPKSEDYPYEEIRVKILRHKTLPSQEGSEYEVEEKYFREVE